MNALHTTNRGWQTYGQRFHDFVFEILSGNFHTSTHLHVLLILSFILIFVIFTIFFISWNTFDASFQSFVSS